MNVLLKLSYFFLYFWPIFSDCFQQIGFIVKLSSKLDLESCIKL